MKLLPFCLLFFLFSCGSKPSRDLKYVKPVNIQFFETYTVDEIKFEWLEACKWSSETDTLANQGEITLSEIGLRGLKGMVNIANDNAFGYVKEKDRATVDSILALPEVAKLFPKNLQFMWSLKPQNRANDHIMYDLYAVKIPVGKKARVDGRHVLEAVPKVDENTGQVSITISMTKDGQFEWELMTRDNINRFIAITMDNKVISCPKVLMAIAGEKTEISGNFSMDEAGELSDQINAGK